MRRRLGADAADEDNEEDDDEDDDAEAYSQHLARMRWPDLVGLATSDSVSTMTCAPQKHWDAALLSVFPQPELLSQMSETQEKDDSQKGFAPLMWTLSNLTKAMSRKTNFVAREAAGTWPVCSSIDKLGTAESTRGLAAGVEPPFVDEWNDALRLRERLSESTCATCSTIVSSLGDAMEVSRLCDGCD